MPWHFQTVPSGVVNVLAVAGVINLMPPVVIMSLAFEAIYYRHNKGTSKVMTNERRALHLSTGFHEYIIHESCSVTLACLG
jgi:hypothetical protein